MEHAEARVRERAMARQRAADRRRRLRSGTVRALRIALPVLGAAVLLAILESRGDLAGFPPVAAAAVLAVPALVSGWLARRESLADAVLWVLVTLAAELALVFGVGLVALGLGPG